MANKLYKQTFEGNRSVAEVQEQIGLRGGIVVRVDQSSEGTTAYFESSDATAVTAAKKAGGKISAASIKEVTRT